MTKSFTKDNPALAFIDIAPPEEEATPAQRKKSTTNKERTKGNPAAFVPKKQTKAHRMHISITENLFVEIQNAAAAAGISANEYINQALAYALKKGARKK